MGLELARALLCRAARLKSKELSHAAGTDNSMKLRVHLRYECKDECEKAKYKCARCGFIPVDNVCRNCMQMYIKSNRY